MKYLKLQTDALKSFFQNEGRNAWRYSKEHEGCIGILNNYMIALIPKDKMFLQFPEGEPFDASGFFRELDEEDYLLATPTVMKKKDKYTLQKFETEDGRCAWIDTAYMKYFEDYAGYYVHDRVYPIFVMEGNDVAGLILPVRLNEVG